ncbi:transcriptional regulator swi6 [Mortierella alpina]|uniref:Transcriptional regulator swi6 n=1 Tax=Mortierella alpina TaxID=64518 RepID=A0A9P6LW23_MORAP|nr:transcriptional regulator swi6 [Mortierella alpina]
MTSNVYTASYSGIPVYETICRGIAVMRRKNDSWLNATQILKVAGIEKGARTRILEHEILPGTHEKIQGGYGKYQGTWIPYQRGKDLAVTYKVEPILRALLNYNIPVGEVDTITPTKEMAKMKNREALKPTKVPASPRPSPSAKRARSTLEDMAMDHDGYDSARPESLMHAGDEEPLEGVEKYRSILMTTFLNDDASQIPSLLTGPSLPQDMDVDLIIDDQGHTALHWAAALARIQVLELLIQKQADVRRVNYNGESALVRAVIVTNNYDRQSFPHLLHILHNAIPLVDRKNRTLLHHIAIAAGIRGRGPASHYYMECLFEWIARNGGDFSSLIDVQDKNGDTALTITARIGDRYLAKFLIDVGANRDLENKVGLKAADFGVDGEPCGPYEKPFAQRVYTPGTGPLAEAPKEAQGVKRVKDLMTVVQKMLDELDAEFSQEILARNGQLKDTQNLLRTETQNLTEMRKSIKQCRQQALELEEAHHKIRNLELSLEEESHRTRNQRGYNSKLRTNDDIDALFDVRKPDGSFSNSNNNSSMSSLEIRQNNQLRERMAEKDVLELRSRVQAYRRHDEEFSRELAEAKSQTSANELQYKKVIAYCCKIPLDKVDDMVQPLTLAVESDGAGLDLTRVAGFMSRVKQQEAMAP